jgi:two-component system CheB/CheR fusion protein
MSASADGPEFEALLEFMKRNRGFDFTGYKRATLVRRVQKRMETVGIQDCSRYAALLASDPDEFTQLFNTLLINVTRFFRDDGPWQQIAEQVIPALIARRDGELPIRVWSAGCASGEEAYTLAMLFAEALGPERFRARVKIYATDVDDEALAQARTAMYTERQLEDVPEPLRARYFETVGGRSLFTKELRRSVIFGRNDLVQDAPISRIDLLACRNTLMYFNATTQAAILGRFHFALADGGVLLLGRAETLLTQSDAFTPIDLKHRIFSKAMTFSPRERLFLSAPGNGRQPLGAGVRLGEAAFDNGAEAQIVVDRLGYLMLANERARQLFGLVPADVGRPLQDLELSYRPFELRSLIEQSYTDRRRVVGHEVVWRPRASTADCWMRVEVTPLTNGETSAVGVSVLFTDLSEAKRLEHELEGSRHSLETAYEELQSTNEELETTNEELQSTVEELETTNEELQSTNEELETMNEELQSTNEELQTMNDELRRRGEELNQVNAFLETIFASLRGGVVVLDREMRVLVWNGRSEELWGLRATEAVEANLLGLDVGLPVHQLASPIHAVLLGQSPEEEVRVHATNRRGRAFECVVSCTPLKTSQGAVRGVILVMEEAH